MTGNAKSFDSWQRLRDCGENLARTSRYAEHLGGNRCGKASAARKAQTPKRNLRKGAEVWRTVDGVVTVAARAGRPEGGRGGGGGPARRGGAGEGRGGGGVGAEHGGEEAAGAGYEAREPPARWGRRWRRRRGGASGRRRVRVAARGGRLHGRPNEGEGGSGGKMGTKNGDPKINRAGGFGVARWCMWQVWAVRFKNVPILGLLTPRALLGSPAIVVCSTFSSRSLKKNVSSRVHMSLSVFF
jgi:hypothetical protein